MHSLAELQLMKPKTEHLRFLWRLRTDDFLTNSFFSAISSFWMMNYSSINIVSLIVHWHFHSLHNFMTAIFNQTVFPLARFLFRQLKISSPLINLWWLSNVWWQLKSIFINKTLPVKWWQKKVYYLMNKIYSSESVKRSKR